METVVFDFIQNKVVVIDTDGRSHQATESVELVSATPVAAAE